MFIEALEPLRISFSILLRGNNTNLLKQRVFRCIFLLILIGLPLAVNFAGWFEISETLQNES